MAKLRVKRKKSSQPAQHRVHFTLNAAALGWPPHNKEVFFGKLQEEKRNRGALRKRNYEDQLKRQLAQVGIDHQSRQQEASDRDCWRSSVRKASRKCEAERHEAAKERRRRQKERAAF